MLISGIHQFTLLDYPGKIGCIVFTPGCNFRCGFCHNPEFVLPEEIAKIKDGFIKEEAFFNFLKKRKGLLEGVVISGGEPTLQTDLPEFIKKIREIGLLVKLDTNGNMPGVLKNLLDDKLLDYVAMDIKTSLNNYQTLCGAGVDVKKIQQSIDLLKKSVIKFEFRSTLIKGIHTPEVLKEMARMIEGNKLFLQNFRNSGPLLDESFRSHLSFTEDEMKEWVRLFRENGVEAEAR